MCQFAQQFANAGVHGQPEAGGVSIVSRLAGVHMIHGVDDVVAAFGVA